MGASRTTGKSWYIAPKMTIITKPSRYKCENAASEDEIIYPELEQVYYKSAIQKRNRIMIDESDFK